MTDYPLNGDSLPWADIVELAKTGGMKGEFSSIPEETLRFAMADSNSPMLVESALKSLRETDPENATLDNAERVANMMKLFARRIIEERGK